MGDRAGLDRPADRRCRYGPHDALSPTSSAQLISRKTFTSNAPRECRNRVRRPRLMRAARQHAIPDSLGSFSARLQAVVYRLFFSGLRTPRLTR